jgi:hypothetical protein
LKGTLGLELKGQSSVNIKTFGSNETNAQVIDVVNFGIETAYGPNIEVSAFVVPLICQPLKNQYVSNANKHTLTWLTSTWPIIHLVETTQKWTS